MAKIKNDRALVYRGISIIFIIFLICFPILFLGPGMFNLNTLLRYFPKIIPALIVLAILDILTILKIFSLKTNRKYLFILLLILLTIFLEVLFFILFSPYFDFFIFQLSLEKLCGNNFNWMYPYDNSGMIKGCNQLRNIVPAYP